MADQGPSRADRELEDQFLTLRAAKQAERELLGGSIPKWGAVGLFPIAVFAQSAVYGKVKPGWRSWALKFSHEPGSVFRVGVTAVTYDGEVAGVRVTGKFHVVVGNPKTAPPAAKWKVHGPAGTETPEWTKDLPVNVVLPTSPSGRIRRDLNRLVRQGAHAANRIFELSAHTVRFAAGRYKRVMWKNQSWADPDDILQACWERHLQRLDRFASPNRPVGTTWRHWLYTATVRDAQRELRKNPYGVSEVVSQIVSWIAEHPDLGEDVEAIQRGMTLDHEVKKLRKEHPDRPSESLAAMVDLSAVKPVVSEKQITGAMEAIPLLVIGGRVSEPTTEDEFVGNRDVGSLTSGRRMGRPEGELVESDTAANLLAVLRVILDNPEDADAILSDDTKKAGAVRRRLLAVVRHPGEKLSDPAVAERLRLLLFDEEGEPRSVTDVQWVLWEQAAGSGKMF